MMLMMIIITITAICSSLLNGNKIGEHEEEKYIDISYEREKIRFSLKMNGVLILALLIESMAMSIICFLLVKHTKCVPQYH